MYNLYCKNGHLLEKKKKKKKNRWRNIENRRKQVKETPKPPQEKNTGKTHAEDQ